jgi:hypothetical protein
MRTGYRSFISIAAGIIAILSTVIAPLTLYPESVAAAALYESCTSDVSQVWVSGASNHFVQTFTATQSHLVTSIKLKLWRQGNPGTVGVTLCATDSSGHRTGDFLVLGSTDGNTLPTSAPGEWREIVFSDPSQPLDSGVKYAIDVTATAADGSTNVLFWRSSTTDIYSGGNEEEDSGTPGTAIVHNWDMMFQVIGEPTRIYESYHSTDLTMLLFNSTGQVAQTFTASTSHYIGGVKLLVKRYGLPGNVSISLETTDGSGHPYLTVTSGTIDGNSLPTGDPEWRLIRFTLPYWVTAGTKYAIVASSTGSDGGTTKTFIWMEKETSSYAGGNYEWYDTSWHSDLTKDMVFETWGKASLLFDALNTGDNVVWNAFPPWQMAQTFMPPLTHSLTSVKLLLYRAGDPGTVTVSIKATDAQGKPTGTDLGAVSIIGNTLTDNVLGQWREFFFMPPIALSAMTKYAIVLKCTGINSSNAVYWRYDSSNAYSLGNILSSADNGSSWTPNIDNDFMFEVWGFNLPLIGDYNGDGKTDYSVWRPNGGNWFVYDNFTPTQFGLSTDIPVPADYNGDGKAEFAVYRPHGGLWFVYPSLTPIQFGLSGDIPVPGDYNGDGMAEFAVWRPSTGMWYVYPDLTHPLQFGLHNDVPGTILPSVRYLKFGH